MSEGIKWERSGVRPKRWLARIGAKKIVLFLHRDREWILSEDGKRMAGVRNRVPNAEPLLREIAEQHYTHGKDWRAALASAEFKLFQEQAAKAAPK